MNRRPPATTATPAARAAGLVVTLGVALGAGVAPPIAARAEAAPAGSAAAAPGAAPAGPSAGPPAVDQAAVARAVAGAAVVTLTAQPVLWRHGTATAATLADALARELLGLVASAAASGADLAGPPVARYELTGADVAFDAGVPVVKAPARPAAGLVAGELPAGRAATMVFVGRHADLPAARVALARWAAARHLTAAGPAWEVYLTNPMTVRDPAKQRTKLFVPVATEAPAR